MCIWIGHWQVRSERQLVAEQVLTRQHLQLRRLNDWQTKGFTRCRLATPALWQYIWQGSSGNGNVFDEDYPDTLIRAVELRPDPKYDAIIFDEGQDFQDTWWLALEVCLSKGRQSILYVFYGDNQHVYRNPGSIPADLQHFPLTENVRESLNTARVEIGR